MSLTGAQRSRIHKSILDAFIRDELRRVILAGMNVEFSHHVSPEKSYSDQIFEFVTWADRWGRALELLRCAAEGNERNAGLQTLWVEAQTWDATPVQPAKTLEPGTVPVSPHHVFFAYSSKDAELVRQLRKELRIAGIAAWTADEDLELGGTDWQQNIEAAIIAAECVVVIMTPAAKQSRWVNIEITLAWRIEKRIYPVLAQGDAGDAVPLLLETTNYLDVRKDYSRMVQEKLIPALRTYLGIVDAEKPVPLGDEAPEPLAQDIQHSVPGVEPANQNQPAPESPEQDSASAEPSDDEQPVAVSLSSSPEPSPLAFEWIKITEGEFIMGSDRQRDMMTQNNETPLRTIFLDEYQIAKYPVTNAQYFEFVRSRRYAPPLHWKDGEVPRGKEDHPVMGVTQADALAFCEWANVRLPTEAEWEKAARGIDGRMWPWGDSEPNAETCNFGDVVGDTTPVNSFPGGASPYGVIDMAGNVEEWVADNDEGYWDVEAYEKRMKEEMKRREPYVRKIGYDLALVLPSYDNREPEPPPMDIDLFSEREGVFPVLRGGSHGSSSRDVRCAARHIISETDLIWTLMFDSPPATGFRVAARISTSVAL